MFNAYSWDGKSLSTRQPDAPELSEGDTLLYDLPGRCGGVDSHSHHFRVVKHLRGAAILVQHGGGDERWSLGYDPRVMLGVLATLDDTGRYWFTMRLYYLLHDAAHGAEQKANVKWRKAAAEKRIKTKKVRGQNVVKVWIDPAPLDGQAKS